MAQARSNQGFIKLWGRSDLRAQCSMPVLEEVRASGCHWACSYPRGKRPRQVKDRDIIFMGRMVKEPNDILIFGRASGMQHVPGRDDATTEDIQRRSSKEGYPHYIRVDGAEFVAGNVSNGVSLNELMDALGSDAFMSTQRNAASGRGNTEPRRAYMQKASVQLTPQAMRWLDERLEAAFARHGKLGRSELDRLDWPDIPTGRRGGSR